MKFDIQFDVIRKAIIIMLSDPEFEPILAIMGKNTYPIIIDYALHFEEMFYKHEVGNTIEFFNKMKNKEIHRKNYTFSLNSEIKDIYYKFIDNFLEVYNKKSTSNKLSFPERKTILHNTIYKIQEQMKMLKEGMIENIHYNEDILNKIYKKHLIVLSNIENKLIKSDLPVHEDTKKNSNSVSTFLSYIKKANMSYIITFSEQETIYPLLYDFFLHLFLIDTRLSINSNSYIDRKDIFKQLKKVRENLAHPPEDSKYMNIEYLKVSELLTYIKPEELEHYLLYHYAQILKCDYKFVLSVFKQLKYNVTDHHKFIYPYKDFSFVPVVSTQDFRHLSLYVNLN